MQARLVEAQLGADPGQSNPAARLQWSTLSRARTRSLHVEAATGAVDVLGMLVAKVRVRVCDVTASQADEVTGPILALWGSRLSSQAGYRQLSGAL